VIAFLDSNSIRLKVMEGDRQQSDQINKWRILPPDGKFQPYTMLGRQGGKIMKQYLGLGLGMLVGTVIGAAAVSGLHAQAKPPIYLVTEIDVTNPEGYGKEYAPKAQANIKAAGGRFVAVIIVDEMAYPMMVAGKDIEGAVQRLPQMARRGPTTPASAKF
jgi:hypothetical protein